MLLEAERNIVAKLRPTALARHLQTVATTPLVIVSVPEAARRRYQGYQGIINEKDEHVVASAIAAGAPFLITLDSTLAEEVNRAKLAIQALSPGRFITTMLPRHVDYADLRD